ncbi:MAG TPA: TonB-dependent receptor [Chryseosolibacter sp.]|nr:TonB-dependent receptor [Chryseosolibacter sp.]
MKYIFAICLSLCFHITSAQEGEIDTTLWTEYLNEIIVSANRWEQSLLEVPNKVAAIHSAAIKFQNPQTAADLLSASDQVFVQKSQLGGGSPMLRGFATNRVLLVVDGVRMNNAIFRSGNVQNVISLDANAIEEAEVIFGPGSVIYGSDAIGGVMDFHTLSPVFSENEKAVLKGNFVTRYASANEEKTIHADVSFGRKKWAFLSSVSFSGYDDLRMGSNGHEEYTRPDYAARSNGEDVVRVNKDENVQVHTGFDQWNAMQKIGFRSGAWSGGYAFHFSTTSDYARYDRLILRDDAGELANAEWYYGPQRWMMHSLTAGFDRKSALIDHSRLIVAYQNFEESRHNRAFGGARRTNRFEQVTALSVNLDLDKQLNNTLTIYYGSEYVSNVVGSRANRVDVATGEISPASTRYPDGSRWSTYAAYVSLKIKPSQQWVINLSNRFTRVWTAAEFDQSFFNFPFTEAKLKSRSLNGSAGAIYSPNRQWKFYSNLSTGFRAPNIDDIGKVFDSQPGNVVVPNPGLQPERAYNAEIGFAAFPVSRLKLDLSAYYTVVDNAIARAPGTFNGLDSIEYDGSRSRVYSLQNISEIRVRGLQAGFEILATDKLKITSSLSYQDGKEKDPESGRNFSPAHVAPMFGATHVIYSDDRFRVDLYAVYNGEIPYKDLALSERADRHLYAADNAGDPHAPAWMTLNVKGAWHINRYLSVNAGVENIADKRYRPYASGISAPGRNLIIALRVHLQSP